MDAEARARELLAEIYTDEGSAIWLRSPNRLLDGRVPAELLKDPAGAERVLDLLHGLATGSFF